METTALLRTLRRWAPPWARVPPTARTMMASAPAEATPPPELPPKEPELVLAQAPPPTAPSAEGGSIPFARTLTWSSLGDGIKEAVRPDVDSGVVSGNLLFILAMVALVVCKNWSLAVKGHCGGTFQNVSASVALCVSSWR
jgi:hypothetical protein